MTKDWNFNQPLESKSENQEDPDKIAALFGNPPVRQNAQCLEL